MDPELSRGVSPDPYRRSPIVMMRAELLEMQECTSEDPCYVAREWHGLKEDDPIPLGSCWKVRLKHSGEVIGDGGLLVLEQEQEVAELYFRLEPAWEKPGAVAATLRVLTELGFEQLGLRKVQAWCLGKDQETRRAYQEAGLELEEVLRKSRWIDGHWHDSLLFSRYRDE